MLISVNIIKDIQQKKNIRIKYKTYLKIKDLLILN